MIVNLTVCIVSNFNEQLKKNRKISFQDKDRVLISIDELNQNIENIINIFEKIFNKEN